MKNNEVKDWMSSDPVVIPSGVAILEAHQLMKTKNIRRIPVIDNGELVGIVSLGDIQEAEPSDAISLSIYELNYLIAKLTVADLMTSDVITVSLDTKLHDVAQIMLEKKIGGLPVMSDGKVVGIITESDVFRAVMEILD
ncbi:MAG: CBS domain-containing protein [Chloroflexota bacterium]